MENPGPFSPCSFDQVLAGCASLYKACVRLRYAMYGTGFLKSRRLDCPVISIGNLAVGGSGKTPMAIWVARMLVENGLRPVVISRGYRGALEKEAAVVSDGRQVFLDAKTCGDEPYMMAMEKVRRDLNLVLLDYRQPLGNGRMLPAGRLRETLGMAKNRIDGIVFTRCPPDVSQLDTFQGSESQSAANDISEKLPSVPFFFCTHEPFVAQLFPAGSDNDTKNFQSWMLKGKRAVLFSGLARNASFAHSVRDLGVNISDHLEFCDHCRYNGPDFKRILDRAMALNVDLILTTRKDWVKVNPAYFRDVTVAVIDIRLRFSNSQDLEKFILDNRFGRPQRQGCP